MIECKCGVRYCKYFRGTRLLGDKEIYYCKVFKDGIPNDIAFGDNLHLLPIEGQDSKIVFGRGPSPNLVKPFSRKSMDKLNLWGCDNLCATLRDIYQKTDDSEIKYWCRLGVRMSKNMCFALITYKQMLIEKGVDINKHGRVDWQIYGEELYNREMKKNSVLKRE